MQLTVDSGQLPVGWEIKKLGDVCHAIGGGTPSKSNEEFYTGEIPWATVRDMKNEIISETECRITEEAVKKSSTNIIEKGNVVIATRVGLGKVCMVAQDTAINQDLRGIIPKNNNQILVRFLFWWLKSIAHIIKKEGTGATVQGVKVTFVNSLKMPIPTLSEQKQIVTILDEAFEGIDRAIANTEKNLANSRELFESYLNAVFTQKGDGWEEKTLKQVSIQFGRGKSRHRPRNDKKLYGGKYPFIQTGDIRNSNHIVTSYSQTYNEVGLAQSKLWAKGTVCITIAANIAETGVLDFEACIPDSVIGLVVDQNKANNMFVEYMLQAFKLFLKAKGKGSAQDNINMGTFEAQTFPFPSIDKQKRIVAKLDFLSTETQRLEAIYKLKIAALNELKQSILQKAFTGELTADIVEKAV